MKRTIFLGITPCSQLSVNKCFGGTNRFHLQGRKDKLSKETWWYVPPKHRLTLNGIHGIISQKNELRYSAIPGFQNHSLMCCDLLYYYCAVNKWTINMTISCQPIALRLTSVYVFICLVFSELRFLVFKMVTIFIFMFRIIVDVLTVFDFSFVYMI
jgi:hypothetical protein